MTPRPSQSSELTLSKRPSQQLAEIVLFVAMAWLNSACGAAEATAPATSKGKHLFDEETFGGNGRTCRTCHSSENGTLTPSQVEALFVKEPRAPLFRSIDSDDGRGDSYTRLRQSATIRVTLPLPPNIRLKDDLAATTFTVNRAIPTTLDISLTDELLMADGRNADLAAQATGAVADHYQARSPLSPADAQEIADFERTEAFFSSAATVGFAHGAAAPGLPLGTTDAQQRGRKFFERGGRCTVCHDGPMLNSTDSYNGAFGAGSRVEGNLVSANAEPLGLLGGNFSTTANVERTWVIDAKGNGFNGDDDIEVLAPDLGIELVTGNPADRLLFKIPTLRNISNTPPYFHDGSAKTLNDVVNHYQRFINAVGDICDATTGACQVTDQDKADLVEFMRLL